MLTGNVGGSFGMKSQVFPEYPCLLYAARALGRPVKWTDERSESFVSDNHGRDHEMTAELALDADGHILALRLTGFGNAGAYPIAPLPYSVNAVKNVIGVYRTPLLEVNSKGVYTNTQPVGPYRGAGRPEGNYYMERLMDTAAAEMGIDRLELRRRNYIAPEADALQGALRARPMTAAISPPCSTRRLATADWTRLWRAQARRARRAGKLRGRGIASYLEVTAPQGKEMGGIRFEADGGVTMISGTLDYGQGHASPFAQILVSRLGIPFERIRLLQGDSDELAVRRRHRRLALGDGRRHGAADRQRQGDRAGQEDRRPLARGRGRRHRVRGPALPHRRHRPRDRRHGDWPSASAAAPRCRRSCRNRSMRRW